MKELVCIVCPKGCHLRVDEENGCAVTGNQCPRGAAYGKKELQNPTRVLTSTVRVQGGHLPRLPVKTNGEIPKAMVAAAARLLDPVTLSAPVAEGQVVLANILGSGVDVVTTRAMAKSIPDIGRPQGVNCH